MFKVQNTILSEDIATAKFACDLPKCKGACCVVGNAGAPVSKKEIPVIQKAWKKLKGDLRPEALEAGESDGVVKGNDESGYELSCVNGAECVFVNYNEEGIAYCTIQKAFYEGRFNWEKPISCHLFPVRLKKIAGFEYANFRYIEKICSPACEKAEKKGIYLSEFLKKPLIRRYGNNWYREFRKKCEQIRARNE